VKFVGHSRHLSLSDVGVSAGKAGTRAAYGAGKLKSGGTVGGALEEGWVNNSAESAADGWQGVSNSVVSPVAGSRRIRFRWVSVSGRFCWTHLDGKLLSSQILCGREEVVLEEPGSLLWVNDVDHPCFNYDIKV
jgi:hypothetical protein